MTSGNFEVYPISHKGKVYDLITEFDMTFTEVRALLDCLEDRGAFLTLPEDGAMGPGKLFSCDVPGAMFEVDVQGFEVIVYRRTP